MRSIERGLAVIATLGHPGGGLTLAEVARAIGVTRASARRTLLTLEQLGYLRCDERIFRLTPKVLDLGQGYRSGIALPEVARPHLQQLMEATDEFCSVSVLDGDETLCVARVAPARIMNVAMPVGTRLPAYATCVGRVLLAGLDPDQLDGYLERVELTALTPTTRTTVPALRDELDRVRRQRYAVVDQELERGLRSAAAPIRDIAGRVIAAANVGRARRPRHVANAAPRPRAAAPRHRGVDRARPRRREPLSPGFEPVAFDHPIYSSWSGTTGLPKA